MNRSYDTDSPLVRRFPLLTVCLFQCSVSGGYSPVFEYSIKYSIEYRNTKLLNSSSTTNLIIMDHNAIRHTNSCRVRVIILA